MSISVWNELSFSLPRTALSLCSCLCASRVSKAVSSSHPLSLSPLLILAFPTSRPRRLLPASLARFNMPLHACTYAHSGSTRARHIETQTLELSVEGWANNLFAAHIQRDPHLGLLVDGRSLPIRPSSECTPRESEQQQQRNGRWKREEHGDAQSRETHTLFTLLSHRQLSAKMTLALAAVRSIDR